MLANWHSSKTDSNRLLGDVTEILDLGLQTPVPFILHQQRMLVEVSVAKLASRPHKRGYQSKTDPE
jgi:hypothetical protein